VVDGLAAVTAGYPRALSLAGSAIREAAPERLTEVLAAEQQTIEEAPAEVAPDLLDRYRALAAERLDRLVEAGLLQAREGHRYRLSEAARAAALDRLHAEEPTQEQHLARARCVTWLLGAAGRPVGRRALYGPDSIPEKLGDELGMDAEAEALAWVVAAEDVHPPLSVGLFGDWGTGKSYFMQLMQQRVKRISDKAKAEERARRCAWRRRPRRICPGSPAASLPGAPMGNCARISAGYRRDAARCGRNHPPADPCRGPGRRVRRADPRVGLYDIDGLVVELDAGAVIWVNDKQAVTRQRFTLAHELGHHLLRHADQFHLDFSGELSPGATGERPGYNWRAERAANDLPPACSCPPRW
jgi:hypothetical protein